METDHFVVASRFFGLKGTVKPICLILNRLVGGNSTVECGPTEEIAQNRFSQHPHKKETFFPSTVFIIMTFREDKMGSNLGVRYEEFWRFGREVRRSRGAEYRTCVWLGR